MMMILYIASELETKMETIDDIDEELTELEDMVDQLEHYTSSLREYALLFCCCFFLCFKRVRKKVRVPA